MVRVISVKNMNKKARDLLRMQIEQVVKRNKKVFDKLAK